METGLVKKEDTQASVALRMPPKAFLQEYSPAKCLVKYIEVNSAAVALKTDAPSLVQVNKTYGHRYLIGYLSLCIVNLCEYLGKKYAMTEQQINETAELVYIDNSYMTLADITMVLTQIKQGKRGGNLYENINGRKIAEVFAAYAQERADTAVEQQRNREEVIKKHGYGKCAILSENDVYVGYEQLRQRKEQEEHAKMDAKKQYCQYLQNKVKAYMEKHRDN